MTLQELQPYALPAAIAAFFLWRFLRFRAVQKQLPALLRGGALVIDVRTASEYASGAARDSINIPLDSLRQRISTLDPSRAIVLCCASGSRSAMAASILKKAGFKQVLNAGPWTNTIPA